MRLQHGMNPRGLTREIRVVGADDNTRMSWLLPMQTDEVLAIDRQHATPLTGRERQDFGVFNGLIGFPRFEDGQHIVSEPSQFFDNWPWKILVGIQQCHGSGFLVVSNLLVDFVAV